METTVTLVICKKSKNRSIYFIFYIILYYFILFYIILFYIILYYLILYYLFLIISVLRFFLPMIFIVENFRNLRIDISF